LNAIVLLAVAILSAVLLGLAGPRLFSKHAPSRADRPQKPELSPLDPAASPVRLAQDRITLEALQARLKKLAGSPTPANLNMGAKCYEIAAPPDRVDYVCPKCGQRTLYTREQGLQDAVRLEIPEARRLVKEIRGIEVKLDESQFCRTCSPSVSEPQLILLVGVPGQKDPHRVEGVAANDLKLLKEFLQGSDRHKGDNDRETPLKDHIDRIEELLGIGPKPPPGPRQLKPAPGP
jgi:hypothetical protein